MHDVTTRLRRCFAAVFPDLAEDEIGRASATSVGAWDSLATVNLLSVIEEEFGVQVAPEDFETFVSFELIRDYLQGKLTQNVA
jgi:acyl carrier protein